MLEVKINKDSLYKAINSSKKTIEEKTSSILKRYSKYILDRASTVHIYKNRTGNLSKSNFVNVEKYSLRFYNKANYSVFVIARTKNNWISDSIKYYENKLKEGFK